MLRLRSEERRVGKECRSRCDWSSDVCSSDLPVPFNEMLAGVAEINWIDPTVGAVTTKMVGRDVTPAADAVIASVPAQPLSRNEPVATPFTVATPVDNTALPAAAHGEE